MLFTWNTCTATRSSPHGVKRPYTPELQKFRGFFCFPACCSCPSACLSAYPPALSACLPVCPPIVLSLVRLLIRSLSIRLSARVSARIASLSVRLSISLSASVACLFVRYPPVCPPTLSACPSAVCPPVRSLSVWLFVCLSVRLFVCLSACFSVCCPPVRPFPPAPPQKNGCRIFLRLFSLFLYIGSTVITKIYS